ncbi:MAG: DUF2860 family protein [Deltaproteobacteria bacterium]|jgi:hypothetical protein|nr:DUF2860 family protein [Deltaproteobacteria bacterium]
MKQTIFLTIAAIATILFWGTHPASAIEPLPKESGFSGFIRPGIGYLNFKSNMVASFLGFDLSDKKTDSRDDSPDSQSTAIVLAPFSLEYTFASTRTQLFLGTDLTDLVRFDYAQQFGIKQGIGSLGIFQGGILFSGIPAKVWKDPYLVNQNRDETSRDSTGARLIWDRIFGSWLELRYTYRNIDISSEKSGESLPLTAAERRLLERDGDRHTGEILYRFNIAKKHRLTPAFIYTLDDRDGDAMKNDAYDFQLNYGYFGDSFTFTGNVAIGWADYDDKNPIYRKTQEDDRYGIQGTLYYKNPWNWTLLGSNPMNFYLGAAYVNSDANIDFYEQEAFLTTAGVFFKW